MKHFAGPGLACLASLFVVQSACVDDPDDAEIDTGLQLATGVSQASGVTDIRVQVYRCGEPDTAIEESVIALDLQSPPSNIAVSSQTQMPYVFGQQLTALDAGCYDLRAIPLVPANSARAGEAFRAAGMQVSQSCSEARVDGLNVAPDTITPAVLMIDCDTGLGTDPDLLAASNHPPTIDGVRVIPEGQVQCLNSGGVCVDVSDVDGNPLQTVAIVPVGCNLQHQLADRAGATCYSITCDAPGTYEFNFAVYDLDIDGSRIEDVMARAGHTIESHAATIRPFQKSEGCDAGTGGTTTGIGTGSTGSSTNGSSTSTTGMATTTATTSSDDSSSDLTAESSDSTGSDASSTSSASESDSSSTDSSSDSGTGTGDSSTSTDSSSSTESGDSSTSTSDTTAGDDELPRALDDAYDVIGNVGISVPAGAGLLANDDDPDGGSVQATVVSAGSTSAGGAIEISAGGDFSYRPPLGFEGEDSFEYSITDDEGDSATATVTFTVDEVIWFIDDRAATGGDGSLNEPFACIVGSGCFESSAAHEVDDIIFVHAGSNSYTAGLTLLDGQTLIGEGAVGNIATLAGITVPPHTPSLPATGGERPILDAAPGDHGLTLSRQNSLFGIHLGDADRQALSGSDVAQLVIRDTSIANPSGGGASLQNGALDVRLSSLSSAGGAHGLRLENTTGILAIEGDGASDASEPTRGRTTAGMAGTLTLGSGGTISGSNDHAVELVNASGVTLRNMVIETGSSSIVRGVHAELVDGLTIDNTRISGMGSHGIFGTAISNFVLRHAELAGNAKTPTQSSNNDEANLHIEDGAGQFELTHSIVEDVLGQNLRFVQRSTALLDIDVDNLLVRDTDPGELGDGGLDVLMPGDGAGWVDLSVTASEFRNNRTRGIAYSADGAGTGRLVVSNSQFEHALVGLELYHASPDATIDFRIDANTINSEFHERTINGIHLALAGNSRVDSRLRGAVTNTNIGDPAVDHSGSNDFGDGLALEVRGNGEAILDVLDNRIVQTAQNGMGILVGEGSPNVHLTLVGNDFATSTATAGKALAGLDIAAGIGSSDAPQICLDLGQNIRFAGDASEAGARLSTGASSVVSIIDYAGTDNSTIDLNAFFDASATTVTPSAAVTILDSATVQSTTDTSCIGPL